MLNRPDVVVVDDHLLIAEALRAALNAQGITADSLPPVELAELVLALRTRAPRLVLLDLDLGEWGSSLAAIRPLRNAGIPVLLMTGVTDRNRIAEALEQGAIGYQAKGTDFPALLARASAALAAAGAAEAAGGPIAPLDPSHRAELLTELAQHRIRQRRLWQPFEHLTEREAEALRALCRGWTVRDIAANWVVSEATVRSHVRGILTKLDVVSQLAAVALAGSSGWLIGSDRRLAKSAG